jgi:hypothetical protein
VKVGDLVKFQSDFFSSAAEGYANPGIIIKDVSPQGVRQHYRVMWSDQRITTEHISYLVLLTSS